MTASRIGLLSIEERTTTCRYCGARIRWARTVANRKPIALDEHVMQQREEDGTWSVSTDHVHWATCKQATVARRDRATRPSESID